MEKSLTTIEELKRRKDYLKGGPARYYDHFVSLIREEVFIVLFKDGSQANVNKETLRTYLTNIEL